MTGAESPGLPARSSDGTSTVPDLIGARIVVTAGGTTEPIDPVRVITNLSTGKMGTALARAALTRGADVTLISSAGDPVLVGLHFVPMSTVASLRQATLQECVHADVLIMAAAVSDFRPVTVAVDKIKKSRGRLLLELEPVDDFIHELQPSLLKVGFAAETRDLVAGARAKLGSHGFDLVCANPVGEPGSGFGSETNQVTIVGHEGSTTLPCLPKLDVAHHILDHIVPLLG